VKHFLQGDQIVGEKWSDAETGFDQAHFTRRFKLLVSVMPGAYQKDRPISK
jgi:hypothetical protein